MTDPVGYARKSPHNNALKLTLSVESVEGCIKREASNGVEFYDFYVSVPDIETILDNKKDAAFIVALDPDENETETFIVHGNNTELSGAKVNDMEPSDAKVNDYRKVRKLSSSEDEAKAWCRLHYPDFEPHIVAVLSADHYHKKFYDIELRPPSQLKMEDY